VSISVFLWLGANAMSELNDPAIYRRLDPEGLLGRIRDLPRQCRDAWQQARALRLPDDYSHVDNLLVLGVGGSAIGGDLLSALAVPQGSAPVSVVRGYDLPAWVDANTLVVACSYSGETEETLSAFQQALERPCKKLVVTTGGHLLDMARQAKVPAFRYEYPSEPRSTIGYGLMALLSVGERLGLVDEQEDDIAEAVSLMDGLCRQLDAEVPSGENPAKQLAARLQGRLPVVFGAGVLAPVARRWKTQLNENSNVWAAWEELPEADHNTIVGFALPREVADRVCAVFLYDPMLHPRVILRYRATQDALERAGVACDVVEVKGSSPLSQVMTGILWGDYVSYYLAILNGVSPSPVEAIVELKKRLADE
jgi:glucose/mannose-6-phosphate isomerase